MDQISRVTLMIAGVVSLAIGVSITFATGWFYAGTGVSLPPDPSLLSELRAEGAVLQVVGGFLLLAVWRAGWRREALWVAALYFGAYGLARVYSIMASGWPVSGIVAAMVAELTVALVAAGLLLRGRAV
jgi:hypothetical protein